MGNPLFGSNERPPEPPPPPYSEWLEPAEKAFSLMLPAGWQATGRMAKFQPNLRYACYDLRTAGGGIVFEGDPDVPLRYAVPQPWHTPFLGPRDRIPLGEGPAMSHVMVAPYPPSAAHYALEIARKRFGPCRAVHAEQLPQDTDRIFRDARQAGADLTFADVVRCRFDCDKGMVGEVRLGVYGGMAPVWDVDFVKGFMVPPEEVDMARATLATFQLLAPGQRTDARPQEVVNQFVAAMKAADNRDRAAAIANRDQVAGIWGPNPGRVQLRQFGG